MIDEEVEKYLDEGYEKLDQQEHKMRELGLIMFGDSSYYILNPEEYEKDKKICELENEVERLKHRLSNCIEPKFKQGDYFIEYWNETQNIYQYEGNKHFKCLNKKQGYHCDYVILGALLLGEDFIEPITEEETKAKLRSLEDE